MAGGLLIHSHILYCTLKIRADSHNIIHVAVEHHDTIWIMVLMAWTPSVYIKFETLCGRRVVQHPLLEPFEPMRITNLWFWRRIGNLQKNDLQSHHFSRTLPIRHPVSISIRLYAIINTIKGNHDILYTTALSIAFQFTVLDDNNDSRKLTKKTNLPIELQEQQKWWFNSYYWRGSGRRKRSFLQQTGKRSLFFFDLLFSFVTSLRLSQYATKWNNDSSQFVFTRTTFLCRTAATTI